MQEIKTTLLKHFPLHDVSSFVKEKLLQIMSIDKKNEGANIMASLLSEIGKCEYDIAISKEEIKDSINYYINL